MNATAADPDLEPQRLGSIAAIGERALADGVDGPGLDQLLLGELVEHLPCDDAALLETSGTNLVVVAAATERSLVGARIPLRGSVGELALRSGTTVVSPDVLGDTRLRVRPHGYPDSHRTVWCVPLRDTAPARLLVCVASPASRRRGSEAAFVEAMAAVYGAVRRCRDGRLTAQAGELRRLAQTIESARSATSTTELRNTLTTVIGFADLLARRHAQLTATQQELAVTAIGRGTSRLVAVAGELDG